MINNINLAQPNTLGVAARTLGNRTASTARTNALRPNAFDGVRISEQSQRFLRTLGNRPTPNSTTTQMWQSLVSGTQATRPAGLIEVEQLPNPQSNAGVLFDILKREIRNASQISTNLASAIDAFQNNPNASLEERAMQRESALRTAQHIADTLLSGETAEQFLAEVNRMIQNDVRLEQGFLLDGDRNATVEPFQMGGRVSYRFTEVDGVVGRGKAIIPNFMLWAAERNGMNIGELEDIFHGALGSESGWNRLREILREFGNQAYNANFGAIEESWVAERSEQFAERAEEILNAINATVRNFDALISQQRFTPIQQWHDNMMALIESVVVSPSLATATPTSAQGAANNGAISNMARANRDALENGQPLTMRTWSLGNPQPMPGMPQSTLRVWDFTLQLTTEMRGQQGNGLESSLQALTNAYETIHTNLTGNSSGNSQNHVNFLEAAFRNMALSVFEENARAQNHQQYGVTINFDENGVSYVTQREGGSESLQRALDEARIQADQFADAFLSHFNSINLRENANAKA